MLKWLRLFYSIVTLLGFAFCSEAARVEQSYRPLLLTVVAEDHSVDSGRFEAYLEKIFKVDEALRQFRSLPYEIRQETLNSMMRSSLDERELSRIEDFMRLASLEEISVQDIAQYITKHYQNFRSFQNLDLAELTLFVGTNRLVTVKNSEPTHPSSVSSL